MADFPSHPDAVTTAWLGDVLGRAVSHVEWQAIGTGQVGDSVRFALEYAGEAGPATLAAKFPAADETSRNTAAMFGLYRKEVEFYRQVAAKLSVRVPQVHFAEVDASGGDFILLFEDLGPARGGNQIAGCTLADAEAGIRQAAAIHAPSMGNRTMLDAGWLQPPPGLGERVSAMYEQAQAIFRERYADTLEPELMRVCEELAEARELWFLRDEPPQRLIHGDFRLDNMLFDIKGGAEEIAVLDWQTVALGNPMVDVGYFLGCGIGNDLRRQHEGELLDLYCSEMTRRGVSLSREAVWDDYVVGALHGVSTAVFSAAFVERTERGDANFLSMARGACGLALEHGSIEKLKERAK
ncbi:MAG: phosphotransferase [Sphingomonadaceae bacterium]|nr:phosphotransferase [Sphingomonadaceae bacterium]MCP5384972.1 phosphotransferase [Altererythrobacter sp.]